MYIHYIYANDDRGMVPSALLINLWNGTGPSECQVSARSREMGREKSQTYNIEKESPRESIVYS